MRDFDVRTAIRGMLHALHAGDDETLIVEEMGIWSGSVRIDVAVVNGELCGYELKSERDTLDRLARQAELYSQVFDRVVLVAADRHINAALAQIPTWWGVITAEQHPEGLVLANIRRAAINPAVDPLQVARLLWRRETLMLLERRRIDGGVRSKPAETLARRLAEFLPLDELRAEVRSALKARTDWR